jgi:hypothetical protein
MKRIILILCIFSVVFLTPLNAFPESTKESAIELHNLVLNDIALDLIWMHPKKEGCEGLTHFEIWLTTFVCIVQKNPQLEKIEQADLKTMGITGSERYEIVAAFRKGSLVCTIKAIRKDVLNYEFNQYVIHKNPWAGSILVEVYNSSGKLMVGSVQN